MPVLVALNGLMEYWKKDYVYPSQSEIVGRLGDWYDCSLSRRQLNRVLLQLEANGMIRRTRRHRRSRLRGMEFHSTLYHILARGWRVMRNWGVISAERFKQVMARVLCFTSRGEKDRAPACNRAGAARVMALVEGLFGGSS
jgi:hypothetical protein